MQDKKGYRERQQVKRALSRSQKDLERMIPRLVLLEAYIEVSFLKRAISEIKKTERLI